LGCFFGAEDREEGVGDWVRRIVLLGVVLVLVYVHNLLKSIERAMGRKNMYFQTPKHLYFSEALEDAHDFAPFR